MQEPSWSEPFKTLGKMIDRLQEVLDHPQLTEVDYLRDAAFQRFELVVDLFVEVFKKIVSGGTDDIRDILGAALQYHLIKSEAVWIKMVDDRNRVPHTYQEAEADRLLSNIQAYFPTLEYNYRRLKWEFSM